MSDDKIIFHIENYGDPSVGISGFKAMVTLNDPIGYDEEDIQFMKGMFADHYDVPIKQVHTDAEWQIILEKHREMDRQLEIAHLEARKAEMELFKHMETCDGCPECDQF